MWFANHTANKRLVPRTRKDLPKRNSGDSVRGKGTGQKRLLRPRPQDACVLVWPTSVGPPGEPRTAGTGPGCVSRVSRVWPRAQHIVGAHAGSGSGRMNEVTEREQPRPGAGQEQTLHKCWPNVTLNLGSTRAGEPTELGPQQPGL